MMKLAYCRIEGVDYKPCVPCPDNETLAKKGKRLILRHGNPSRIFVASKEHVQEVGWVIGTNIFGEV